MALLFRRSSMWTSREAGDGSGGILGVQPALSARGHGVRRTIGATRVFLQRDLIAEEALQHHKTAVGGNDECVAIGLEDLAPELVVERMGRAGEARTGGDVTLGEEAEQAAEREQEGDRPEYSLRRACGRGQRGTG